MKNLADGSDDPMAGLVTPSEAAELIRHSKSTLDKWRCIGKGPPSCKIGSKVYYPVDGLQRWVGEQFRKTISSR